jgi:hypothetical protein
VLAEGGARRGSTSDERAVFMPFLPKLEPMIRGGFVTASPRPRRYGAPGDMLRTPFGRVVLVEVRQMPLSEAAIACWRRSGSASARAFQADWIHAHPEAGSSPETAVWVHEFRRVRDDESAKMGRKSEPVDSGARGRAMNRNENGWGSP